MLCLECGEFRYNPRHVCDVCGHTLVSMAPEALRAAIDARVAARVRELKARWVAEGSLPQDLAERIETALKSTVEPRPRPAPLPSPERARDLAPEPARAPSPERESPPKREALVEMAEGPGGIFSQSEGALSGVEVFAALDPPELAEPSRWESEIRPLLYENIGWFIGTLLVLAGSIYGVREAWRSLDGLWRHVVVTVAFGLYHAGFVGLARLLSPRSASTGRVLGGISVALLPVVFISLSSLFAVSLPAGLLTLSLVTLGALATLASASRRFEMPVVTGFSRALLPALVAHLPLLSLPQGSVARWLIPLVGIASVARTGLSLSASTDTPAALFASLYGLFSLSGLCLIGAPETLTDVSLGASAATLWASSLCAVAVEVSARPALRARYARAAELTEVWALGLLAALLAASALRAFSSPAEIPTGVAAVLHAVITVAVFTRASERHPAALHVALPTVSLGAALLAHALMTPPAWWTFAAALAPSVLGIVFARSPHGRARTVSLRWAALLASLGAVGTASLGPTEPAALCVGLSLGLGAHASGALGARWMHYVGALGAMLTAFAWLSPRDPSAFGAVVTACAVISLFYGLVALARPPVLALRPLDDVSLGAGIFAALLGLIPLFGVGAPESFGVAVAPSPAVLTLGLVGLGLIARAARDLSRGVSLAGACALGAALFAYASPSSAAQQAITAAVLALGATGLASLRPGTLGDFPPSGRALFGAVALPCAAPWRTSFADGFAGLAALSTLYGSTMIVGWMNSRVELERPWVVLACALLSLSAFVGFLTRAFGVVSLRGSVMALALTGALAALGGVANRLGSPLPPRVVGLRLSLMIVALWSLARILVAYGPRIGARLEKPEQGRSLHMVPHVGVFALGALLGLDAVMVASPDVTRALAITPPTLVLGAALAFVLLGRSWSDRTWLHPAVFCSLLGAALVVSTRSVLGPLSAARSLAAPSELWIRAELGISLGALSLGLLSLGISRIAPLGRAIMAALLPGCDPTSESVKLRNILEFWILTAAVALFVGGWWSASITASCALLAAGASLLVSRARRPGVMTAAAGTLLLVHAGSCGMSSVPLGSGALLAGLSVVVVLAGPATARRYGVPPALVFSRSHVLATGFGGFAMVYALAEGARPTIPWGASVLRGSLYGLAGEWLSNYALSLTATLVAGSLVAASVQWSSVAWNRPAGAFALGAALSTALAADSAVLVTVASGEGLGRTLTATVLGAGTLVALSTALVALLAHIGSRVFAKTYPRATGGAAEGLRKGRDFALCASGLWAGGYVLVTQGAGLATGGLGLWAGLGALSLAVAISLDAAWREASALHVYFVQSAIVGVYAMIRVLLAPDLSPEFDAVCALVLGFALVGVTVQARRAGIVSVAVATRRFAALLPVAAALVLPELVSVSGALAAAGASVLYGLLGYAEKSRVFGSLGAAAANIALLVGALASGLSGVEVYLGPLGLFVSCLGQLFAGSLERGARVILRVSGSLLLYLPAAVQLAFQVGNAQSGMYPVLFGGLCLAGVGAGMLLHIRAYLALGTVFLVLDVVESLIHAGLRNHRVGFVLLSSSGLGILGVMVLTTLKREAFRAMVARLRARIGGWD